MTFCFGSFEHGNSALSCMPSASLPRESSMRSRSQEFHRSGGLNSHNGRKQNRDPYETKSPVRSKPEGQSKPMRSAHSEYNHRNKTVAKSTWDRESAPQSKPKPQLGPKSEAYHFIRNLFCFSYLLSFLFVDLAHFMAFRIHAIIDLSMTLVFQICFPLVS